VKHDSSQVWRAKLYPRWLSVIAVLLTACSAPTHKDRPRAPYVPLAEIETIFGPLVTAGNHPTPDQVGTGDRVGLFRDSTGTIWGLPLTVAENGAVKVCAPNTLRDAPVTDRYPAGATVIGSTNEPTGWRGGTGKLELLLQEGKGKIEWRAVNGSHIDGGPGCWAQDPPGPKQLLLYYRLAPTPDQSRDPDRVKPIQ
jgi:hypothetical protein